MKKICLILVAVICFGFAMPPDYPSCPVPGTYQSISVISSVKGRYCGGGDRGGCYEVKINNPSDKTVSFEITAVGSKNIEQPVQYKTVDSKATKTVCFDATNTSDYYIERYTLKVTSCY